jgi:hypothetical protein
MMFLLFVVEILTVKVCSVEIDAFVLLSDGPEPFALYLLS